MYIEKGLLFIFQIQKGKKINENQLIVTTKIEEIKKENKQDKQNAYSFF